MSTFISRFFTGIALALIAWLLYSLPTLVIALAGSFTVGFILIYELPQLVAQRSLFVRFLVSPLMLAIPFLCAIALHASNSQQVLAFACIITATFDTGSYIFGKLYGTVPIAPAISPGKTFQGALGGLFTAFIVAFCIALLHQKTLGYEHLLFIVILCGFAFLGDLFESWLKRQAGVKDSGTLLPGHGGLLDRLDSLLFTVPFCYLLKRTVLLLF